MSVNRVTGICEGCHQKKDLVVEEKYCSPQCKERRADLKVWIDGFCSASMIIFGIAGLGFLIYYLATYPSHHLIKHELPTKAQKFDRDITELQHEQAALETMRSAFDAVSSDLSNRLQRAIADRESSITNQLESTNDLGAQRYVQ